MALNKDYFDIIPLLEDCDEYNIETIMKYYLIYAKKGNIKSLKQIIKSVCHTTNIIHNVDIFSIFKLCIKYQHELDLNYINNLMKELWTSKLNEEQRMEFIELIHKIKIEDDTNVPFLLKSFINLITYNLDVMKLHFDYTLNGLGYEDAKKDFISKITKTK